MKLYLKKLIPADFPFYFQLVSNAQVMAMITERPFSIDEAQIDFDKILQKNKLHPTLGSYKVVDNQGTFIGFGKLEIDDTDPTEAELGYMILPALWGKGFGKAIGQTLVNEARKHTSLVKLNAIIDPKNTASRKILTNIGFITQELCDFDGLPGEILALNLV